MIIMIYKYLAPILHIKTKRIFTGEKKSVRLYYWLTLCQLRKYYYRVIFHRLNYNNMSLINYGTKIIHSITVKLQ